MAEQQLPKTQNVHTQNAQRLADALRSQSERIAQLEQVVTQLNNELNLVRNEMKQLENKQIQDMINNIGSGPTS